MARALFEVPQGTPDGTRTEFQTSTPFRTGSTAVFLNGFVLRKDLSDGWTELGNTRIQMKIAPLVGDVIQVYYLTIQ